MTDPLIVALKASGERLDQLSARLRASDERHGQLEAAFAEVAAMATTAIDSAELDAILSDPFAMAGQLKSLLALARSEFAERAAKIDAAMEKLLAARVAQAAEHSERDRELTRREAAVAERERSVEAESRRVYDRERWVEQRAADLTNRLHA